MLGERCSRSIQMQSNPSRLVNSHTEGSVMCRQQHNAGLFCDQRSLTMLFFMEYLEFFDFFYVINKVRCQGCSRIYGTEVTHHRGLQARPKSADYRRSAWR